jgi:DNA repair protein RadC
MKTIHVHSGHSPGNPKQHCSDGDSSYVTGSFENTLVRLTGIDAFEVSGKKGCLPCEDMLVIESTDDVVPLVLLHMVFLKQEQFRVIFLDSKNRFIRTCIISIGSLDKALVEPRDVFRPAFTHAAASIILVHNHPSGDPTSSEQDILLTQQLCSCGKILGIEVIDHVIIGISGYSSFKKRNLI